MTSQPEMNIPPSIKRRSSLQRDRLTHHTSHARSSLSDGFNRRCNDGYLCVDWKKLWLNWSEGRQGATSQAETRNHSKEISTQGETLRGLWRWLTFSLITPDNCCFMLGTRDLSGETVVHVDGEMNETSTFEPRLKRHRIIITPVLLLA